MGTGKSQELPILLQSLEAGTSILLVSDPGVIRAGLVEPIRTSLEKAGYTVTLFDGLSQNPRDTECLAGAALFREASAQMVVAIGGGSAMDTGKTIALIGPNGGTPAEYADGLLPYANIAPIIRNGADWFANIGTEKSKGTKVFALAGQIRNTGLIEVPMGTTLRQIVEELGGGAPQGSVKAVQTGGPSGGCIPASLLDTPVDYDSLAQVGSIMGSGGMIVMDETTSMVDVAHYFMEFCRDESCGKCIPCRVGTVQLERLLSKIRAGQATWQDLEQLKELCKMVQQTSLCGLGQSAPNPVLSTLRYFHDEYEALLKEPISMTAE